jgi:hypothetical protein
MSKRGRPKLGDGITTRFTVSVTLAERTTLQALADKEGISLARCLVTRAMLNALPKEIAVSDLELMLQIANRCGGKIQTSVLCTIVNSGEH